MKRYARSRHWDNRKNGVEQAGERRKKTRQGGQVVFYILAKMDNFEVQSQHMHKICQGHNKIRILLTFCILSIGSVLFADTVPHVPQDTTLTFSSDSVSASVQSSRIEDSLFSSAKDTLKQTPSRLSNRDKIEHPIASVQPSKTDSLSPSRPPKKDKIEHPIVYSANDSIVMQANGVALLYGSAVVDYEAMELQSEFMRVHMDSNLVFAAGIYDTTEEEWVGEPKFKDGNDSYQSHEITYNMKTEKGFIRNVTTTQGEGYITADKTKRVTKEDMMMAGGRYTTCDDHDHPHYYIKMTKAKVRPGEHISTGPAYLVIGDVPLPLAIPFGFFPFSDKYASGLIMPTFGDDYTRGFYLRGLGYYFAISDYADFEITGDIYTRGTWAIYGKSTYIKRYKFRGNFSANYRVDVTGERDMPDYMEAKNFNLVWTHSQDAKANPYSTFSSNVNFSTSGYNRSNINSYYNAVLNSENTKSSSINYTQRFPNSPWSISSSFLLSQRTKDSTLSVTIPDILVSMSRIYPFKRKYKTGKERWYEKISLQYSTNAKISVSSIKEDRILHSNFLKDWQSGLRHTMTTSASFTAFKYLSITPNFTMTDRMYFLRTNTSWNDAEQIVQTDTTYGFYNVFDFNVGLGFSTKIYGFFTPIAKLFPNSRIVKLRHVMTPHFSLSYHPDFGSAFWGYHGSYTRPVLTSELDANGRYIQKVDDNGNPVTLAQSFSRFNNIYGNAPKGLSALLSFGLDNNLELKVLNRKDTTGDNPYKIISLIDNFSINGAYNFAADSMRFSNFTVNLRIKLPKVNYTVNLTGQFDPYMYEINADGNPVRTNKQYWHNGRFPHFLGTSTSLNYTFNNQFFKNLFKKKKSEENNTPADDETDPDNLHPIEVHEDGSLSNGKLKFNNNKKNNEVDNEGYEKVEIPWSLTVSYTIRYAPGNVFNYKKMYYKMVLTHNLNFTGSISLGKGWKISATTSYDFMAKRLSYTNFNVSRDLHCWNMSASFVPFGPYKSYTFHIGVNASMLRDLKYDKSSVDNTNKKVNWW